MNRLGQFFFKYRTYLFPVVLLPIALGTAPRSFLGSARADLVLDLVGLFVVALGQGLRVLVIGLAYIRRGGKDKQVYASRLVQHGIFAHSRNPLYLGNLLIVVGLALVHDGPWMYLVVVPFFALAYAAIIRAEETYLSKEFGAEYAEYVRRVPRLFPRLSGIGGTVRGMRFQWRRVVRKDYGTIFTTCTGVLLLVARQSFDGGETFGLHASWPALLGAWTVLAIAWWVARKLKFAGALRDVPAADGGSARVAAADVAPRAAESAPTRTA